MEYPDFDPGEVYRLYERALRKGQLKRAYRFIYVMINFTSCVTNALLNALIVGNNTAGLVTKQVAPVALKA